MPPGAAECLSCKATHTRATVDVVRPPASPAPGRAAYSGPSQIGGYRILRELGAGGMGAVFEAFEQKMDRRVALKILSRHVASSENAANRFEREAWIAGKLNHPNLVRVFERGEDREVSFFSMELVDGGSLNDVIRNLRAWGKDESWGLSFGSREYVSWAIGRIIEAARGLHFAHRQGVVHRDIKPMNILLNRDPPAVKVADFGLAVDLGATRLTSAGRVMGTVAYMAPEQIRGRSDLVDARTDVYSLGVTLFELLTLELPFTGETQQIYLNAVLTSQARRPRKLNERVGRDLETVIQKSLEKDREDRYASAAAFAEDLENVVHFRPITARPPGASARLVKWARRRPLHAVLAAVLLVGLPITAVLGIQTLQHRRLVERLQVEGWREEAGRLLHDHRFREALEPLGSILAGHSADIDALQRRSVTFFRVSLEEKDVRRKADLEKLALDDITKLVELLPRARWPYRVRAFLLRSFGQPAAAAEDDAAAARYASAAPEDIEFQIDGVLAMVAGDYSRAVEAFGELIRRHPDSGDARQSRGDAFESLGDPGKAAIDYEVASALNPSDVIAPLNLARLKTKAGALAEAEGVYRRVLALAPETPQAHQGLAHNLLEQGRSKASGEDSARAGELFRQAEAEARKAVEKDPSLAWAWLNLGASLVEQSRLLEQPDLRQVNEAIGCYGRAIDLSRGSAGGALDEIRLNALVNQCDALIVVDNLEDALDICRRVTELSPDNPAAHYNFAAVHALSGRADEAFKSLQKDFDLGDRDWQYLASDRWFESLRSDPRFRSLLDGMKKAAPPK